MLGKNIPLNNSLTMYIAVSCILSLGIIATSYFFQSSYAQQQNTGNTSSLPSPSSITSTTTITNNAKVIKIQAGGGNKTAPYTAYTPSLVNVKVGQSIVFYNPTLVAEPHTVTFVFDNSSKAELNAMFSVKNSSDFIPVPPTSNSQPVIIPSKASKDTVNIMGTNARASNAVVIDSTGNVIQLGNNPVYTIKGNEKYVNSGLLFPKGMGPPNGTTSFTVSFDKAGTYNYYCLLHNWQKGTIVVK